MGEVKHPLLAKLGTPPSRYNAAPALYTVNPPKRKRSLWGVYWVFWLVGMVLTGFIIPELHALLNEQEGDTLSENIRLWVKPETPGGGAAWLSVVVTLMGILIWLWGHIEKVPGWPLTGGS